MPAEPLTSLDPVTLLLVAYLLGTALCWAGTLAWQPIGRWLGR